MMNERAFLAQVSSAKPEELIDLILQADADEARVLRIYLGDAQFQSLRAASAAERSIRGVTPKLGNVVVLHGIMGGELTLFNNDGKEIIWLSIFRLIQGQFDRLELADDGTSILDVRASGIYMRYYASQIVSLSNQWNVLPFFYDWRRDIRNSADDLRRAIDSRFGPTAPVHLVAHSMGGLVSRSFIQRHPDRWATMRDPDNMKSGGRLIFLGTPNYGSFAIPLLFFGTNEVLQLLSRINVAHLFDRDFFIDRIRTFPGAYQMLPVRGRISGLDPLFRSETYTRRPLKQHYFDEAEKFHQEISGIVDPARMIYVAGYNRPTPAAIRDLSQLGSDEGYTLSRKGDGTVPHDLGLLDGVKTFYVDEEHSNLPQNRKVLNAMTELLQTGAQQNEQNLFFGLSADFAGDRGTAGAGEQASLQAAETSRKSIKMQQAEFLRASVQSRGSVSPDVVTPEEQALADLLLQREPLAMATPVAPVTGTPTDLKIPITPVAAPPRSDETPSPKTTIRIHLITGGIEQIGTEVPGDIPIDCISVGHYYGVQPSGAEYELDKVISPVFRAGIINGKKIDTALLITQFHARGILRGELGEPFLLPDPREGHQGSIIAIVGMGRTGEFGVPELSVVARELSWTLAQIGKRHLATVLIGASKKNLSIADAVHGWMVGLNRALATAANGQGAQLQAVTFVVRDQEETKRAVVAALRREARDLLDRMNFEVDLTGLPDLPAPTSAERQNVAATRISIGFENAQYRFSAMTDGASIAERIVDVNPQRISNVNDQLVQESDPIRQYKLGELLLDFLFPPDLRAELIGAAPIVLALDNASAQIHWELAAQPKDEPGFDGGLERKYLGLMRGLTRQLRTSLAPPPEPPPPQGHILRVLLVADTCREFPLPGAQIEATRLLELFEAVNKKCGTNRIVCTPLVGPAEATALNVLMQINEQPSYDVLHYAGHCFFDREKPSKSGYLFSGGDVLNAGDLRHIDRTPKFVFSNACESGVLPSRADLRSPELAPAFAEAFFAKGVANFVCTAWPISDKAALDFAVALYSQLLGMDGAPCVMWQALREARRSIANTLTWGAYQHYGNPYFQLLR